MEKSPQEFMPVVDVECLADYPSERVAVRGLDQHLREQLIRKSNEPHILQWTPKDAASRFVSHDSILERQGEGTEYYAFVDKSGGQPDLATLIWYSPRNLGDADYTFAIRSYGGYEGKGYGSRLLQASMRDFGLLHPEQEEVWLSVMQDNKAAQHLYEKTGFVHTNDIAEDGRYIMTKFLDAKNPKIVVIGGGTGSFTVLSGLKNYTKNLTAVVNMADDGGSSGGLRDEYGVLPPGDVRQCLVALAENDFLRRMFMHRFEGGSLNNHTLGNIMLTGAEQIEGDFESGLEGLSVALNITGKVVPVTKDSATVFARLSDGTVIQKEKDVGRMATHTDRPEIWLEPEAGITDSAREAIEEADVVVIAPGNLYGSLAPALVVKGMAEALASSNAKKVYISNLVTKPGQTEGFKVRDFASEIERFIGKPVLDYVLFNTDEPTPSMLDKYTHDGEYILEFDLDELTKQNYTAVGLPLIAKDPVVSGDKLKHERSLIRHDSDVLAREIIKLLSR